MSQPIKTITWGIIGCGDVVARKAASGLLANPGQTIVVAMRRNQDALMAFGRQFGVAQLTTDANEVLAHPDVDMIYVATPPHLHLDYVRRAAAAGKGVLVEKPAGRCAAETRAMVDFCVQAGVPCFVSYYRRHLPRARKLQELLGSGAIGPIQSLRYTLHERSSAGGWRQDPALSGGGSFQDLAGHVLDQLDLFLGPLRFHSGQAVNLRGDSDAEDLVHLAFTGRSRDGRLVPGQAEWNFAATDKVDQLEIVGSRGRILCPGMKLGGEVRLELDRTLALTGKGSALTRLKKTLRNRYLPVQVQRFRFARPEHSHAGLFAAIAAAVADGAGGAAGSDEASLGTQASAASRVADLVDGALAQYYGGRQLGWWQHPEHWQSQRSQARRGLAKALLDGSLDISPEILQRFARDGWAGPFQADIAGLASTFVPAKERKDLHLSDPQVFAIATHPDITGRVAALLGSPELSIFKTRMHTKVAETLKNAKKHAVVPWHQDVGDGNGGFAADGRPVETWTVWLALDDVGPQSGPLCVLPGTHRRLYGDYRSNFHAKLVERGDLSQEDLTRAVPLTMRRGEFVVFHSWLLHGSAPNDSHERRAGFNIRFVRNADLAQQQEQKDQPEQQDQRMIDLAPFLVPAGGTDSLATVTRLQPAGSRNASGGDN